MNKKSEYCCLIVALSFILLSAGCRPGFSDLRLNEASSDFRFEDESPELSEHFVDVSFVDEKLGWAVSRDSLWKSVDGGNRWTKTVTFQGAVVGKMHLGPNLEKVQAVSERKILVLSSLDGLTELAKGGSEMRSVFPEEKGLIRGFFFYDEQRGWAVGQSNTKKGGQWDAIVFNTQDGGQSWTQVWLDGLENCDCAFYSVAPLDDHRVFLVGDVVAIAYDTGKIVSITDQVFGTRFFGRPVSSGTFGKDILWILTNQGNRFVLSTDSGKTWESREIPGVELVYDMKFLDADRIVALYGSTIWESLDRGNTWFVKREVNHKLSSLYMMRQSNSLFAVGRVFLRISID